VRALGAQEGAPLQKCAEAKKGPSAGGSASYCGENYAIGGTPKNKKKMKGKR